VNVTVTSGMCVLINATIAILKIIAVTLQLSKNQSRNSAQKAYRAALKQPAIVDGQLIRSSGISLR
jgi:uncharacterized membrane protein